jgi:hypothetical protein
LFLEIHIPDSPVTVRVCSRFPYTEEHPSFINMGQGLKK